MAATLEQRARGLSHFKQQSIANLETDVVKAVERLVETCKNDERESFRVEMDGFKQLVARFREGKGKETIDWEKIRPPQETMVVRESTLPIVDTKFRMGELGNKLAVLKLNGGLGTTMGCTGPKSVIEVRSDSTFLDLTVEQIKNLNSLYGSSIPLILMDSFNTHSDTTNIISKYRGMEHVRIESFNQSRFPRILKDSLLPLAQDAIGDKEHWYPPGHGDVYQAFFSSGLLDKLIKEGKEYVFISNVDNLGATVDFTILNWMHDNAIDFVMEVTDKTRSDVKGGTLIEYEGKAKLFEIAQCPPNKLDEFKSIKKFKIFNTNNLWVRLSSIKAIVEQNKLRDMDVIVNYKKVYNKDVIQLETACGAAIHFFNNAKGVNVPRSRFLPVKSTSDLLVIQSNLYNLNDGYLVMSPKRAYPSVPLINLGAEFKKVSDFLTRFKSIPNILELDQLTISGDVWIGSGVTLRGTVIIVANHGNRIDIPDGSILENKVISGNLRILDH